MTSCHGANGTQTLAQLAASNEQHGLQEVGLQYQGGFLNRFGTRSANRTSVYVSMVINCFDCFPGNYKLLNTYNKTYLPLSGIMQAYR